MLAIRMLWPLLEVSGVSPDGLQAMQQIQAGMGTERRMLQGGKKDAGRGWERLQPSAQRRSGHSRHTACPSSISNIPSHLRCILNGSLVQCS